MVGINNELLNNIVVKKINKLGALAPGWHKEDLGIINVPSDYSYFGIIPEGTNKDNAFVVYNYYNNHLYAIVDITGSSNTTVTYSAYLIYIKTDYLNKILVETINK